MKVLTSLQMKEKGVYKQTKQNILEQNKETKRQTDRESERDRQTDRKTDGQRQGQRQRGSL